MFDSVDDEYFALAYTAEIYRGTFWEGEPSEKEFLKVLDNVLVGTPADQPDWARTRLEGVVMAFIEWAGYKDVADALSKAYRRIDHVEFAYDEG